MDAARMWAWIGILAAGCGDDGWSFVLEDAPEGAFLSVWGPSPDDVWIVGGQPDAGVVLRGAEDDWREHPLPPGTPLLNWVHGTGPDDVWVAGLHGTLLHWDGSRWTDHGEEMDEAFWGVYARSPSEAWAVGGASRWGGETAILRVWDGQGWSAAPLAPELADRDNLFKVHHDGTTAWLVGSGGAAMRLEDGAFVAVPTGFGGDLVTAHRASAGGPLVVVGGRGTGKVLVADDAGLTPVADAPAGLNGVHGYGDVAVVVGENGFAGVFDVEAGTLESDLPLTTDILHATWGTPGGTMYAVGGNLATASDVFHGVLLRAAAPEAP